MSVGTIDEQKISQLRNSLKGRILSRGDSDYDQARAIWNGMIDKHPAIIAQCADAQDVMTAITFAQVNSLLTSVRGGGHSIAGNSVCEDGVVIDLSLMKHVHVDPDSRTAKAGGGVLWGELDRATQEYGLATTGGLISTTGIGGFTLGGGMGWLERKYGLTCDNLIAAEVVTADGRLVRASADENPDLFWALRGGGGNFGVVTEFTYQLHPVGPTVLGGMLVWPFDEAKKILHYYNQYIEHLTDDLTLMASPVTAPPAPFIPKEMQGTQGIAIVGCYVGPIEDGDRTLAPLRDLSPALDTFSEMPYVTLQSMLDPLHPAGGRNYWKSDYLDSLSDELIQVFTDYFKSVPSPMTHVDIHDLEGAYGRVGEDDTAFSHRSAKYVVNIVSAWTDPEDDEDNIDWTKDLWSAMRQYSLGATYLNFMTNEGEDRVKSSYGEAKYQRLAEIKQKYDPNNFFRFNHNIKPAGWPHMGAGG